MPHDYILLDSGRYVEKAEIFQTNHTRLAVWHALHNNTTVFQEKLSACIIQNMFFFFLARDGDGVKKTPVQNLRVVRIRRV